MSVSNVGKEIREGKKYVSKTATATLAKNEVVNSLITGTHASTPIALTIPAADASMKGFTTTICQGGAAAVTVIVAAGFGGGSTSFDTLTLTQGMAAICVCDGTYWYACNITSAA